MLPLSDPWTAARRDSRALLLGVQTPPVSGAHSALWFEPHRLWPPAATTLAVALGPPTQVQSQVQEADRLTGPVKRHCSLRLAEAQVPCQLWEPRLIARAAEAVHNRPLIWFLRETDADAHTFHFSGAGSARSRRGRPCRHC